jgi:hypothetical protein
MPDGSYTYQGSFTGKELDFLVEFAINSLLAKGAFPFVHQETFEASLSPYPDGEGQEQ